MPHSSIAPVNEDQTEKIKRTFYSKCGSRILLKYLGVGCPMVIIDCDHAGPSNCFIWAKEIRLQKPPHTCPTCGFSLEAKINA